jgi:uncharacterized cupredoxin-like copper-binding protein
MRIGCMESTSKEPHMRKSPLVALVLATLVAVPLALGSGARTSVNVRLKEFKILPSAPSVQAGKVTFTVKNVGKVTHEFVVVRTNKAPGSLAGTGNEASEKGSVGEVADVKPGKGGTLTVTLKAGKYVLLCNLPGHYKAGQYVGFTVR